MNPKFALNVSSKTAVCMKLYIYYLLFNVLSPSPAVPLCSNEPETLLLKGFAVEGDVIAQRSRYGRRRYCSKESLWKETLLLKGVAVEGDVITSEFPRGAPCRLISRGDHLGVSWREAAAGLAENGGGWEKGGPVR